MVRFATRLIKKRYLNQKRIYTHPHITLPIPSRFHKLLEPYLSIDLNITVDTQPNKLTITLTPLRSEAISRAR